MECTDFVVAREELQRCSLIERQLANALPQDGLLVKVDRFAFTANNITYALLGDQLKYWHLFPAPAGFGNIPVWGFGEVMASQHPNVTAGERLFGFFPMSMERMTLFAPKNSCSARKSSTRKESCRCWSAA